MSWDGKERRKEDREKGDEAHDVLIRLDANLSNFMQRFDEHATEDKEHFNRLYKSTMWNRTYILMAMGGLSVVTFLIAHIWK